MIYWTVAQHAQDPFIRAAIRRGQTSISYADYLRTDWWGYRRHVCYADARNRCQRCRHSTKLQAHHVTYLHLWMEPRMDLLALCDSCHRKETTHAQKHDLQNRRAPARIPIPALVLQYLRTESLSLRPDTN